MNQKIVTTIKVISTVLIISALGLESWNIYQILNDQQIPHIINILIWVERFAILAHFLESILAAYLAYSKGKNPLKYAIYTFFTGTVSLLELLEIDLY